MTPAAERAAIAIAGICLSDEIIDALFALYRTKGQRLIEQIKAREDVQVPYLAPISIPLEFAARSSYARMCDVGNGLKAVVQRHFSVGHNAQYYEDTVQFGAMIAEDAAETIGAAAAAPDAASPGGAAREALHDVLTHEVGPATTLADRFMLAERASSALETVADELARAKLPQTLLATGIMGAGIKEYRETQQLQVYTGLLDAHAETDTLAGEGEITQLEGVGDPVEGGIDLNHLLATAFGLPVDEMGDPVSDEEMEEGGETAEPPPAAEMSEARAKLEQTLRQLDTAIAKIANRSMVSNSTAETGSFIAALAGLGAGIGRAIRRRRRKRKAQRKKAVRLLKKYTAEARAKQAAMTRGGQS